MNATCVEERGCICEHTGESESLTLKAVRLAERLEQSVNKLIVGADQNLGDGAIAKGWRGPGDTFFGPRECKKETNGKKWFYWVF
jgi:hypothetical protein